MLINNKTAPQTMKTTIFHEFPKTFQFSLQTHLSIIFVVYFIFSFIQFFKRLIQHLWFLKFLPVPNKSPFLSL